MPRDKIGPFEWQGGEKLRNVKNVATVADGHIQEYEKVKFADGMPKVAHGARLLDNKTGAVKMVTENHKTGEEASNWILRALGFVGMAVGVVTVVLVAVALIMIGIGG